MCAKFELHTPDFYAHHILVTKNMGALFVDLKKNHNKNKTIPKIIFFFKRLKIGLFDCMKRLYNKIYAI